MTRAFDLPGVHQLTPADVAGDLGTELVPELIDGLHAARKLNQATADAEVVGPGEADSQQREDEQRRRFWLVVGRVPTMTELAGAPRADCVVCEREGWTCAEHRRRPGDPLPLPSMAERKGCKECARLDWPCEAHTGALRAHGAQPPPEYWARSVK